MTTRERAMAVLNYEPYDRLPLAHFGFWWQTIDKWRIEGHIPAALQAEFIEPSDNSPAEIEIASMLGFDFNWACWGGSDEGLRPKFDVHIVEEHEDGSSLVMDDKGVVVRQRRGAQGIPAEVSHTLVDRESWEKEFVPRLQFTPERVPDLSELKGQPMPENAPRGLYLGSLYGFVRDMAGIVGLSYIQADDEDLYYEILDTVADLTYRCAKGVLEQGAHFDYAHFWEDICFKNGPLVTPSVFEEHVGPHYKRITDLCRSHGVNIISLDCDGWIDALIPTWFDNGVNTMFPIEVGTWGASIAPWRQKYGRELRGVGGMNKLIFAEDYAAVDAEIERLRPLVELGGYIPCPDHRIPPDAKWENVQYYCDQMRKVFG